MHQYLIPFLIQERLAKLETTACGQLHTSFFNICFYSFKPVSLCLLCFIYSGSEMEGTSKLQAACYLESAPDLSMAYESYRALQRNSTIWWRESVKSCQEWAVHRATIANASMMFLPKVDKQFCGFKRILFFLQSEWKRNISRLVFMKLVLISVSSAFMNFFTL